MSAKKGRRSLWFIIAGVLVLVVVAIAVPLALTQKKSHNSSSSSSAPGGGSIGKDGNSGASGSKITMDDGTTFVYENTFGGFWAADPKNPFGPGGQAQNWSKAIGGDNKWDWSTDAVRGVNLG